MVLLIAFHTKDPDGLGYTVNICIFPDLSPSAGSEAALLERRWNAILGGGGLTSSTYTSLLAGRQKFSLVSGWDKAASQMKAWAAFCRVFLGEDGRHTATFEMFYQVQEIMSVRLCLCAQARQQVSFPTCLLCLIHK